MIPTARCLASRPGFLKRSAEEIGRFTKTVWNLEALETQTKPRYLLDFEDEGTVAGCKTMADRAVGGFSTAKLDYVPADPKNNMPAHAHFHGSISTKLPNNWRVQRTGYAAFRNQDRGLWLFGRLFWDVDMYEYLALRVKSDGRRYTVNVQTDTIIETDIHQHRLFTRHHTLPRSPPTAPERQTEKEEEIEEEEEEDMLEGEGEEVGSERPDDDIPQKTYPALADFPPPSPNPSPSYAPTTSGWETILIRWSDFVRTNHGVAIEPQTDMMRTRVKSIGIGLTDRVEGPYDLRVHRIWATNGLSKEEMEEERRICGESALGETAPVRSEKRSVVDSEEEALGRLRGWNKK